MGGSSSTTTQKLSKEQSAIMKAMMNEYMPGGVLRDRPTWTPTQADTAGHERVIGFNADQNQAFQMTRDAMGTWKPQFDEAASYLRGDEDKINRFFNPFQSTVVQNTTNEMARQRNIEQLGINDAAAKASAFGGSRHGIMNAETSRGWADMIGKTAGELNFRGWSDALNRTMQAGQGLLGAAKQGQEQTGKDIDALLSSGNIQQGQEQTVRDQGYQELMNRELWEAQLGQMLSGFTPGPSTTTTSNAGMGQIFGSMLGSAMQMLPMLIFGSDPALKENVREEDPEEVLRSIARLTPVSFDYRPAAQTAYGLPEHRTGVMADDYAETMGQPAPEFADGYRGIDMADLLGKVTVAIQALEQRTRHLAPRRATT